MESDNFKGLKSRLLLLDYYNYYNYYNILYVTRAFKMKEKLEKISNNYNNLLITLKLKNGINGKRGQNTH